MTKARPPASKGSARVTELTVGQERLVVVSFPLPNVDDLEELTPAEREVARLVLAGHGNAAIAEVRGSALRTVANQLASIYRKLGVSGRSELAVKLSGEDR